MFFIRHRPNYYWGDKETFEPERQTAIDQLLSICFDFDTELVIAALDVLQDIAPNNAIVCIRMGVTKSR